MKTALHSFSLRARFKQDPEFTVFRFLDEAAALGFGAVEIMSGAAGSPPDHIGPAEPPHLREVMRHAERAGVRVLCASTYNDFAFTPNEAWRLDNIAYVQRWCALAGDAGIPFLRLLTGYKPKDVPHTQLEALVRDGIRRCLPHAERHGVTLVLENHSAVFEDVDALLGLLDEIGHPNLVACPDPTNWDPTFFRDDATPAGRERVFASAARYAPRARHAHLKVKEVGADGRLAGWGDGLARLLQSYRDAGYDGHLAFELVGENPAPGPVLRAAREAVERTIATLP